MSTGIAHMRESISAVAELAAWLVEPCLRVGKKAPDAEEWLLRLVHITLASDLFPD